MKEWKQGRVEVQGKQELRLGGVKNSKLKGETLKQEITGEDVASNMGQTPQSKTQSLTFIRWLSSFHRKPHTGYIYGII